jgi:release factor glutamine methyltransferase
MNRSEIAIMAREYLKNSPHGIMDFNDGKIIVLPTVLPPDINTSELAQVSEVLVRKFVEHNHQCRVFEMGTGTGGPVLSVAKIPGVVASAADIVPMAVLNAQANAIWWEVSCDIYQSDLFENVPHGQFDLIIWNIPWLSEDPGEIEDIHFKGGFDPGYKSLWKFLNQCNDQRLAPGGQILLAVDRFFCNRDAVHNFIDKAGFDMEVFRETTNMWAGMELQLDFLLLSRK